MKKILAVLLSLVFVFSLCACVPKNKGETREYKTIEGAVGTPDEFKFVTEDLSAVSTSDESSVDEAANPVNKYDDNLKGLCKYLKDKNCVFDLADAITSSASLIGADEGYKFVYNFEDGLVDVEVYSYSDRDNQWYKQAQAEGKITISEKVDNTTFEAILSENGKYMMVYHDSKNREDRKEAVVDVFNSFYAEAK